jgi:hypothetical protein
MAVHGLSYSLISRHPKHIVLHASVPVRELEKLGAKVLSYGLWRIKRMRPSTIALFGGDVVCSQLRSTKLAAN